MSLRGAAALTLTLLAALPTRVAPATEIIVPGEHVSTERCRLSVVGFTDARKLDLYLNGEFWGKLTVIDSVFHANIRLPYGLNEIEIIHAGSDSTSSPEGASVEILCGPRFSREEGRLFSEYRFHTQKAPSHCLKCHANDRLSPATTTDPARSQADWCYPCHSTVRQRLEEHTVDKVRPCTGCHRIDRDLTVKIATTPAEKNPCYGCHPDKIGLLYKDYVHGPVAAGGCTACHDPHGSAYDKTLTRPVPVLCEACHTQISGQKGAVQHYPFAQGWCVECHEPHAATHKWVLSKKGKELCIGCHFNGGTGQTHQHPYGVKPKHKLASQLRLGEDGYLECLSCHEPHAADAPHLLRTSGENICLGCHSGN